MNWQLIVDEPKDGRYNMDFDIRLAAECRPDEAFFRLYGWKPYTISLGANQSFDEINLQKAENDGLGVVKRPTGGRAILHAEEITYSAVIPASMGITAKEFYARVSEALAKGIAEYHPALKEVELESVQPDFPGLLKKPSGALCFASAAKSEIKFNGRKLVGSAQRKMNSAILQHGSILCGTFHRRLPRYLFGKEDILINLEKELTEKTTEIETIIRREVDYNKLSLCLIDSFQLEFNMKFESKISGLN